MGRALPGNGVPGLAIARALRRRSGRVAEQDTWPHTDRFLPWGIALFVAMIWLVPFDSANLPISLPLAATLDRPFLFLLGTLWLMALFSPVGGIDLRSSGVHRALALFAIVAMVSLLLNHETLARLHELDPALKRLSLPLAYGVFFALAVSVIRPREVPKLSLFLVVLASITALGTLIEYRLNYNVFYSVTDLVLPGTLPPDGEQFAGYDSIGRKLVMGPTVHPLAIAMMMAIALPFALSGFLHSSERRGKLLYGLAVGLMVAGAVATQRKTSFVVPATSLIVVFFYRPRAMARLLPLGIVMLVAVHAFAPGSLGSVIDQLKPGHVTGVNTTKDRVRDYDALRPEIAAHPLTGRGFASYDQKKYRILDNQFLTLSVEVGLLGILAYLAILGTAFWYAHRCVRSRDPARVKLGLAAAPAIVAIAVGSFLMDTLALPQLPFLFCLVAAMAVVTARAEADSGVPTPG